LAKRLSKKDKEELIELFSLGKSIYELSEKFKFSKLTISRNLKKNFGEKKYRELIENNKKRVHQDTYEKKKEVIFNNEYEENSSHLRDKDTYDHKNDVEEDSFLKSNFVEITPLDYNLGNDSRKDLSSIPLSELDFPRIVYMVVDKKIELEIKQLKDFPEWQFLPQEDLSRKTIEIFFDLNLAKRSCNKEQKVLKVPNTDVFRIASPVLIAKGISRIVCAENLIAL